MGQNDPFDCFGGSKLKQKKPFTDVESLAAIVSGELSIIEYSMSHSMPEVEEMRQQLERCSEIGSKPSIMADINSKIIGEAMAINPATNPRGLLDLKERLERAVEE